jgi:hypothetical protein
VAFHGLPQHVAFCSRCVISNQRPNSCAEFRHTKVRSSSGCLLPSVALLRAALHGSGRDSSETRTQDSKKETIKFNDANVCDACLLAATKRDGIDWSAREKQLLELLDKHRSKDGAAGLAFAPGSATPSARVYAMLLCVCALAGV